MRTLNFNTVSGTQTISTTVDNTDTDADGISDATDPDDDNDGLDDTVETNTGTFVDATNTGTNPLLADTDGDGFNDGAEVNGTSVLGRVTSPLKKNYATMTVAGNFQSPDIFQAIPYPTNAPVNVMTQVSGQEFAYTLDFNFRTVGNFQAKFAAGSWTQNWGGTTNSATVAVSGGADIPFTVAGTGFHTFSFNHDSLAYSIARKVFADFAAYAAAYALTGDESADQDSDGITNGAEFTANTDPTRANDALAPVITLANNLVALEVGGTYTVDAATATDNVDGNISANITNNSATILDATALSTPGTYTVTYSVTDAAGNTGTKAQTVVVHAVGAFASQYNSIAVPGAFNGWSQNGSAGNALTKTANFQWSLVRYFTDSGATGGYKFLAGGSWGGKEWAPAPLDGGGNSDLAAQVTANGWYVFALNELTDTASLTLLAVNGTTDVDNDGLPDSWEAWYGAFLGSPSSDLDPTVDYNGNNQTTLEDYNAGLNPTQDVTPPTITLDPTLGRLTLIGLNGTAEYSPADVTASDGQVVVTTVPTTPDTSVAGLIKITYTATDAAGNSASVSRVIAVGDALPNYHGLTWPRALTVNTAGNGSVYGQIFVDGATQGTGAAPNIQAWVGVSSTNDNPNTWAAEAWTPATYLGEVGSNDEYTGVISGVGRTVGTPLYYALRWQIGTGPMVYSGVTATGAVAGDAWGTYEQGTPPVSMTYGNGTLTVEASRQVTFAVNMNVQIFKGEFNPAVNGVEVRGDFNNFSGGSALTDGDADGIYTGTFAVGGTESSVHNHKFVITGPSNYSEWEFDVGTPPGNRKTTLLATGADITLATVFFSNIGETRKISISVDMSKQIEKGVFNAASNSVSVVGSVNAWTPPGILLAPAPGLGANIYSADLFVDGPLPDSVEYKFYNNAVGAPNSGFEASANRIVLKADIGAANLSSTTIPTVLFSNDDGLYPTDITLSASAIAENNAVNDVIGTLSATDLTVGDTFTFTLVTGAGDTDNSAFNISGNSLRASQAFNHEAKSSYSVRVQVTDRSGTTFAKQLAVTVTDVAEGSSFAGWSGGATLDSTNLAKYAIGGASSLTANDGQASVVGGDATTLTLTAIVRTDDNTVTITGEASSDLGSGWSSSGVSVSDAASQAGVPQGCTRKVFSVTRGSDDRKFIRIKATKP